MKQARAALPLVFGLTLTVVATLLISASGFRNADAADDPYRCDDGSLYFPVAGIVGWRYGDPASTDRDASGNPTVHTGVDIFADGGDGAPVYAPADGMVSRLSGNGGGVNLILYNVTNVLTGTANIEIYITHFTHTLALGRSFQAGDVIGRQSGEHIHLSVGAFMGFDDRELSETQDPSPYFGAVLSYDESITDRFDVEVWCDPRAADVEVAVAPTGSTPVPGSASTTDQPVAGATAATVASQDQDYFVQPGDTLSAIAADFDVTVDAIATASGLDDIDTLTVGQHLIIPGAGGSGNAGSQPGDEGAPRVDEVYIVQAGDTLSSIAEAFGVAVEDIVSANGLSDADFISVGQALQLESGAGNGSGATGDGSTATGVLQPIETEYVVVEGDTLSSIAEAHGIDVEALQSLNGIEDPTTLQIGDILLLP